MGEFLIQMADSHNQLLGLGTKKEANELQRYRRIAYVLLHNPTGDAVLLQRRAKEPMTGRLTASASGHADSRDLLVAGAQDCLYAGEDERRRAATYIAAAAREAEEEIGARDLALDLRSCFDTAGDDGFQAHCRLFTGTIDYTPQPSELNPREVASVEWYALDDLEQARADHPHDFTTGFQRAMATYFEGPV